MLVLIITPVITNAEEMGPELDDWYIGFGIGASNGYFNQGSEKITFEEYLSGSRDYRDGSINFKVGIKTTVPGLLAGLDVSSSSATGSVFLAESRISITNVFAMATYFPYGKGLFLRGGGGLSSLKQEIGNSFSSVEGSVSGTGILLGVGYHRWIGRSFGMSINFDVVRNQFDGGISGIDAGGATSLYIGFDWY